MCIKAGSRNKLSKIVLQTPILFSTHHTHQYDMHTH